MTNNTTGPGRKELYAASMVIFVGVFYLLSVQSIVMQVKTMGLKNLKWDELKWLLLAIVFLFAGISFLRGKPIGWVFCAAILLNLVVEFSNLVWAASQAGGITGYALILLALLFLSLLAFAFVLGANIRRRFKANNRSYLFTILICALLLCITFL
jgi:hypothetical protein